MREQGRTYQQIASDLGVTIAAVYFALNPGKREIYAKRKAAKTMISAASVGPIRS